MYKYGGVCLLVKNDFVHLCQEVTLNSTIKHYDGILWCILGNILLGVVYIPPCRSVNLDDEIFEKLQNDIVDIDNECDFDDICLLGDFNGRIGTNPDFTPYDDQVIKLIDDRVANEILLHNVNDNIDCRISSDSVLNEQGKKLLSLCKYTGSCNVLCNLHFATC